MLGVAVRLATEPVDRLAGRRRGQPAAGVGRHAVDGPALEGDQERLARGVLGDVEVTEAPRERGDHPAELLAVDPLEALHADLLERRAGAQASGSSWKGRTSTLPAHAFDPFWAHTSAPSRSGASITQKPPRYSFDSA